MTTRMLNAIDPETAQRIRDRIAGKPLRVEPAKPKRQQRVKCYASQFHKFDPAKNTHTVQLPIAFDPAMYNAGRVPWYLREKYVKTMREAVWLALSSYLRTFDRTRIVRMEFVRIGVKKLDSKDNLRSAFKSIVDATCSWVEWGDEAPKHVRAIGYADDRLEQRGIEWTYRQQQCESNPRLYAIRIVFHCTPLTTE